MQLSESTLDVLRNFAGINQNLLINPGSTIKTISEAKNLMDQDIYPDGSFGCDTCRYLKKRWDVSQKI